MLLFLAHRDIVYIYHPWPVR